MCLGCLVASLLLMFGAVLVVAFVLYLRGDARPLPNLSFGFVSYGGVWSLGRLSRRLRLLHFLIRALVDHCGIRVMLVGCCCLAKVD